MIRTLIIEDDVPAAELTIRQLESAGLELSYERVSTEMDFRTALARAPDLILSDSSVPGLNGMTALSIATSAVPATPFIFVSGTIVGEDVQKALAAGAAGYIPKFDLSQLPATVRAALASTVPPARRATDKAEHAQPAVDVSGAAEHLLKRRAVLDQALRHQDSSAMANIMRRTPPSPAALLMIQSTVTRERFAKLLRNANIELDEAENAAGAIASLDDHIHALMFTDSLDLVRDARQLPAGAATHIIFIDPSGELGTGDALRAGANDCMPSEARGEQFWAHLTIARRIVDLAASLQLALTDNRILSTIDELTRCGSRRFFEHQFPREVQRAVRLRHPLALVMCDIDHFKTINDRYGHQVGDEVLREFASRITNALRVHEDWVARVGGEEFAVVLPETASIEALAVAKRLCERISTTVFETSLQPLKVTASFGVCTLDTVHSEPGGLPAALIKAADAALYESKRTGRNRVTASGLVGADEKLRRRKVAALDAAADRAKGTL
ncbi:MAG: diguanylate cyclase [Gammaproteobacteria bacterium]